MSRDGYGVCGTREECKWEDGMQQGCDCGVSFVFDKWFCTVQGLGEVCHSDQANIDSCCERFVLAYDCQCARLGVSQYVDMWLCSAAVQ